MNLEFGGESSAERQADLSIYSSDFYRDVRDVTRTSATEIVPFLLTLIEPKSIVDVGCGLGTWLSVFVEHGVDDVCGVDGNQLDSGLLEIPRGKFLRHDLRRPLHLNRRFDLVLSLEVAEHIHPTYSDVYIDSLVHLGSVVLFSAAIPFQGGTGHLNEQWPTYWVDQFARRGYVAVDCLRKRIWSNERVAWWYAQNMLLFVERATLEMKPPLQREFSEVEPSVRATVHPDLFLAVSGMHFAAAEKYVTAVSLRALLSVLPSVIGRAVSRRARTFSRKTRRRSASKT